MDGTINRTDPRGRDLPLSTPGGTDVEVAQRQARDAMEASGGLTRVDFASMNSSQILAFMSCVMRDVDQLMAARADVLQRRNEQSRRLGEEIAVLESLLVAATGDVDGNLCIQTNAAHDIVNGTDGRETLVDPDEGVGVGEFLAERGYPDALDGLTQHDRTDITHEGARYIAKGDIEGRVQQLKDRQNSISASNELDMIGFQSIVQTRQMFVNLATQMMSSQHGAQNNVVQNIGR